MPTLRDSTASNLDNRAMSEKDLEIMGRIFKFQNKVKDLNKYLREMKEIKKTIEEANQSIDKIK